MFYHKVILRIFTRALFFLLQSKSVSNVPLHHHNKDYDVGIRRLPSAGTNLGALQRCHDNARQQRGRWPASLAPLRPPSARSRPSIEYLQTIVLSKCSLSRTSETWLLLVLGDWQPVSWPVLQCCEWCPPASRARRAYCCCPPCCLWWRSLRWAT